MSRRRKMLLISEATLLEVMSGCVVDGVEPLPADARIVGMSHDLERGGLLVCIESDEYEVVPPNFCFKVEWLGVTITAIVLMFAALAAPCSAEVQFVSIVRPKPATAAAPADCLDCLKAGVDSAGKRYTGVYTRTQYHDPATDSWASEPARLVGVNAGACASGACGQQQPQTIPQRRSILKRNR